MTRRLVWISVLLIAVIVLGAVGFSVFFEKVPVKSHEPPQGEARRNPYLALERFMAQMGQPLKRSDDAQFLDHLAPGGVIILDANRRSHMSASRVAKLLAWVDNGGYLITTPEAGTRADPLLAHFDLGRRDEKADKAAQQATANDDEDDEEEAQPKPAPTPATPAKRAPKTITVQLPDSERTLTVDFRYTNIAVGKTEPLWMVDVDDFGPQILHFEQGKGHVTVVSQLSLFSNGAIGHHDHAELLWSLIQTYQPAASVTLMTRLHLPSLGEWLTTSAWPASVAALVLLLLWLWRVAPRFGPAAPEPEAERRQIREHLTAIGRYVWRSNGLGYWLKVSRDGFLARLKVRHPAIALLPPERQAEALARITQRPHAMIATALYGQNRTITEFTAAVRTLRSLERSI